MVMQLSVNDFQTSDSDCLPAMLGLDPMGHEEGQRYFYASPLTVQRLATLNQLVGCRNSPVILVLGEKGSGKTTLMNQLIADKRHAWQVCRIHLRLRSNFCGAAMRNLQNRMVFFSRSDPPSVIVDDAHQFSESELRLLVQSAFAADGARKLQSIVMFAELPMRERFSEIASALPPMTGIDKIFMAPLNEKQTGAYLEHRVRTAGLLKTFPFSADQIRVIHQASRGLPGWINSQAILELHRIHAGKRSAGILSRWMMPLMPGLRFFSRRITRKNKALASGAC
jgi:type II secretory pathway predicted ATPase ExeA